VVGDDAGAIGAASVRAPAALTLLREKVDRGERLTAEEVRAIEELEWRLTRDFHRAADEALALLDRGDE
jgi:hypothetical protein